MMTFLLKVRKKKHFGVKNCHFVRKNHNFDEYEFSNSVNFILKIPIKVHDHCFKWNPNLHELLNEKIDQHMKNISFLLISVCYCLNTMYSHSLLCFVIITQSSWLSYDYDARYKEFSRTWLKTRGSNSSNKLVWGK